MHPEALKEQSKPIFSQLKQFPEFYLAGGTALALQIGHRVSVDFDLFSDYEIEKALLSRVKKAYPSSAVNMSVNNPDELTLFIANTKVTFLYYPFPTLFDAIVYEGIKLLSVKELAATKAYTIGRRGSYKDYIDLYFVFSEKHATLDEVVELAKRKYGDEFNARLFLEQLIYLVDIEDMAIEFLRGSSFDFDKVKLENFFASEIKKIKL